MRTRSRSSRSIGSNRDLLLLRVGGNQLLVVSCDSAGGIGSKRHDIVRVHPQIVGKMTARVALMELLAIGADPISLACTLAVEPNPTGNQIVRGIMSEVQNAHFRNVQILCSSEKNMKVTQTGVGVTGIGLVSIPNLKIGRCRPGDEVVAIGEPHVGYEVLVGEKNRRLADTWDVCTVRTKPFVHETIPVGSRGILYEARIMAKGSNLSFRPIEPSQIDFKKSAGPATVLLCAIQKGSLRKVRETVIDKPTIVIGQLEAK